MVTDTVNREIERAATELGIPLGMALLYEEQPTNWSLVLELSDYLRDHDDEQGADCLQWVAEKRRGGWGGVWGMTLSIFPGHRRPHTVPGEIYGRFLTLYCLEEDRRHPTTHFGMLTGVVNCWRLLSPEQTAAIWDWEPPQ